MDNSAPLTDYDIISGKLSDRGGGGGRSIFTTSDGQATDNLGPNTLAAFEQAAIKYQVPADILMGVAEKDSGFDAFSQTKGLGPKTRGIIALNDEDVNKSGVNPYEPAQNVGYAAQKFKSFLDQGLSVPDAVKAMKFGPNRDAWGPEAENYAQDVLGRAQKLSQTYFPAPEPAPEAPKERPGYLAQFGADVSRGFSNLKNIGIGAAGLVADAAGFDDYATSLLNSYVENEKQLAKDNPAVIGSYDKIGGVDDAARYAIEAVGENVAMFLPALATGGIGAAVGKRIAERGVTALIEDQVAKGVARDVARANAAAFVERRLAMGAAGGAYASSAPMEAGSIYGDIYEKTGERRPGLAAGAGAVAGALDVVEPVMAIRKAFGPAVPDAVKDMVIKAIAKRVGVEGAKQFAIEAGTEGLQTIVEQASTRAVDGKPLFTPELLDEVVDSALKGGIGGGVMGVGSQIADELRRPPSEEKDTTARDPSAMRPAPGTYSARAMEELSARAREEGPAPGVMSSQAMRALQEQAGAGPGPATETAMRRAAAAGMGAPSDRTAEAMQSAQAMSDAAPSSRTEEAMRRLDNPVYGQATEEAMKSLKARAAYEAGAGVIRPLEGRESVPPRQRAAETDAIKEIAAEAPGRQTAADLRDIESAPPPATGRPGGQGPLSRVLGTGAPSVAPLATAAGQRVVLTDENGSIPGIVVGQDAEGIMFKDDTGFEQLIENDLITSGKVSIAPEDAAPTPAPAAPDPFAMTPEQQRAEAEYYAGQTTPVATPITENSNLAATAAATIPTEPPPAPPARSVSEMSEEELRARLKFIAGQGKANGWNPRLIEARKEVERAIDALAPNKPISVTPKPSSVSPKPISVSGTVAKPEPPKDKIISFSTAKGSTYQVHEDGTTTRNKAARNDPGHEGDSGPKKRSSRTIYVDSQAQATALSSAGVSNRPEGGMHVILRNGKAALIWQGKDGKWGASSSGRDIPFTDTPDVKKFPVELWNPSDLNGETIYGGQHAGNMINMVASEPAGQAERREKAKAAAPQAKEKPKAPATEPPVDEKPVTSAPRAEDDKIKWLMNNVWGARPAATAAVENNGLTDTHEVYEKGNNRYGIREKAAAPQGEISPPAPQAVEIPAAPAPKTKGEISPKAEDATGKETLQVQEPSAPSAQESAPKAEADKPKPFNEYGHYKGQSVYVIDNSGNHKFDGVVAGKAQNGGVLVDEPGKAGSRLIDNPMRVIERKEAETPAAPSGNSGELDSGRSFTDRVLATRFNGVPAEIGPDGRAWRIKAENGGYIALRMPNKPGAPPTYFRPAKDEAPWSMEEAAQRAANGGAPASPAATEAPATMPNATEAPAPAPATDQIPDTGKKAAKPKRDAKRREEKKAKAEPAQPKRGEVGMMLSSGEIVTTTTGRETTPFPKIGARGDTKRVEQWLMDNAIAEAKARGDNFNLRGFEANRDKPSQADKDSAEMYLFDPAMNQPVPKPFLKPLGAGAQAEAPTVTATPPDNYGADNKFVTRERAEQVRAELKAMLKAASSTLNTGVNPKMLALGTELAMFHIEAGSRKFADFVVFVAQEMEMSVSELKPYLRAWYNAGRDGIEDRGGSIEGTDDPASVKAELARLIDEDKANAANEPGRNTGDRERVSDAESGREPNPQQAPASENIESVEAGESANVEAPDGSRDAGQDGVRDAAENVGGSGAATGSGNASNRRPRNSRKRASNDGAGGTGEQLELSPPAEPPTAETVADVPPAQPKAPNFHIDNPLEIVGGGQVARFDKNRAAIELFLTLRDAGRPATPEEQKVLAGYTGWGSFGQELFQGSWDYPQPKPDWKDRSEWLRDHLGKEEWESAQRSITNSHYTDPPTVLAMWDMVRRLGFDNGRVLEPGMGVGNFFGMMPKDMKDRSNLSGIELDVLTGGMAKLLYPQANVQVMSYVDSKTPDNFYDLVIGNWPFENTVIADRRYNKIEPVLHDYYFLKAVDQVRPGGLVVGITSNGTMDKKGTRVRATLAKKAELVAAIRLPTGAFQEYAGTKVVTDIVILKKRDEPLSLVPEDGWTKSVDYKTPAGQTISVNEYWLSHPQNVIGTLDYGHGTTSGRPGMIVHRPENMAERLRQAIDLVPESIYSADKSTKHISFITNHTADREGALTTQDGKLYIVTGEHLAPANEVAQYIVKSAKDTAAREAQLNALIDMRQKYAALIEAERGGKDAEPARTALNTAYKDFVKNYGALGKSFGLSYLEKIDDPFYPTLAALEIDGKPAAILARSTMRSTPRLENPSIQDAYVMARNGAVSPSLSEIAALAKRPEAEVKKTLIDSGAAFETPTGDVVPSDIYLSGNVRQKLREAEAAAKDNPALSRNVEALRDVQPKDIPYFNIETQLGATWVPPRVYADYIAHMLNRQSTQGVEVSFANGRWRVSLDGRLNNTAEARTGFGTDEMPFSRLVNLAIGNQVAKITRRNSDGTTYVDQAATEEVNERIGKIREGFSEWLWSDPERRVAMEAEYNEINNSFATPKYDGSFLSFVGMALQLGKNAFNLRKHQVDAIWRAIVNRKSINAHEVGTGKTFTMGGIAVESRRYGIAKKPMILAHNANSKSVAAEIQQMYPAAKILYIDNFSPDTINVKMRQIANDDWDAIVVPHSVIDRFAFTEETLMRMAQEEIDALEAEARAAAEEDGVRLTDEMLNDEEQLKRLRSVTAKQLVKQRNAIIQNIRRQAQRAQRENGVTFEELGVDMIMVDEAHEFKKPTIATRMNLKGLNKSTSARSIQLRFITDYVRAQNGGANVHLFTGTPITNTLTEIFHQMRYVMAEEMEAAGISDWDGWFGSFAREVFDIELNAAAEYEGVSRLAAFINVPELRRMIGQYMDVVFADDMPEMAPRQTKSGKTLASTDLTEAERAELLNGRTEGAANRPYKKIINVTSDMTEDQKRAFEVIQGWARAWRQMSPGQKKETMRRGDPESPIITEGIANKVSFDARLLQAEELAGQEGKIGDEPNSKLSNVIRNVKEIYDSHPMATQVIFTETGQSDTVTRSMGRAEDGEKITRRAKVFSPVKDMIARLVASGIPREQIALVDGSTTKDKRKEIAQAMNEAKIRVVIGNTQTLGVGVNMQRNLRAMHHIDAPYMPGDLEQRNGRGHRQGNQWNTVLEFRYMTDRLDGRRWQILARKDTFIKAFMKANTETRTIEGDAAADEESDILQSFAEAAGDPRILIREKLNKKLDRLRKAERVHSRGIADAVSRRKQTERRIEEQRGQLKAIRDADVANKAKEALADNAGDKFQGRIGETTYDKRKDFDAAYWEFVRREMRSNGEQRQVGEYAGYKLTSEWKKYAERPELFITIGPRRFGGEGGIQSVESSLRRFPDVLEKIEGSIAGDLATIERLKEVAAAPFQRAKDLADTQKQLADLDADIQANPVPPPAWLRLGAPTETEIFWDGRPFIVTGHRWTQEGWFVVAEDAKGSVTIPYNEVNDKQGMPIYEERTFEPPVVIEREENPAPGSETRASIGQSDGMTADALRDTLTRGKDGGFVKALIDAGRVVLHDTVKTAPGFSTQRGPVQAAVTPDGTMHFVAGNLDASTARGVLLHEAFHAGGETLLGSAGFRALLRRVQTAADSARPGSWAAEAKARAEAAGTSPAHMAEEIAAYAIENAENAPAGIREIADRIVGAVKAFILRKFGKQFGSVTPGQLRALAASALRAGAPVGETRTQDGVRFTVGDSAAAFKRWFGSSKVVDAKGNPLVVYHGTADDFSTFDKSKIGSGAGHKSSFAGFFFSADANIAGFFPKEIWGGWPLKREILPGQNIMPVYLSIKNPLVISANEFRNRFVRNFDDAVSWKNQAIKDGYDGILIQADARLSEAMGGDEYAADAWIAFRPEQIKSATGNNGSFDPSNPDIRFSIASTAGATKPKGKTAFERATNAASDFLTQAMVGGGSRPGQFSSLALAPVRALFTELAAGMPSARGYIDTKQAMDAFRNEMNTADDALLQDWLKWSRKNKDANSRLMDVMHDSTLEQYDPTLTDAEAAAKGQTVVRDIKDAYNALPTEAKEFYAKIRDAYSQRANDVEDQVVANVKKALTMILRNAQRAYDREIERIRDEGLTGKDKLDAQKKAREKLTMAQTRLARNKAARIKRMRQYFESNRLKGPYFPLARFGNYFITLRDEDGKVISFEKYSSRFAQRARAEELREVYGKDAVQESTAQYDAKETRNVDPGFLASVDTILDEADVDIGVRDAIYQAYLETMPDLSMRKARIHRKGTEGFDKDAVRAFAHNMFHSAHQLSRLRYGMDLQDHLAEAAKQARNNVDPIRAQAVYNEMVKSHEFTMNPEGSPLSHHVTSAVFLWTMAFNLSTAMVNTLQSVNVGIPNIAFDVETAGNAGIRKATRAMVDAGVDFVRGKGSVLNSGKLSADERAAVTAAYDSGLIDSTQAHDLAGVAESGIDYRPGWQRFMRAASMPMHQTERFNREVTFLAAYRVARDAGLDHVAAIKKASDQTWATHFDNQSNAKPRFARGQLGKMLFALKSYQANFVYRIFRDLHQALEGQTKTERRTALKRFASMFALTSAAAGIRGAFFYSTIMAIAGAFMGLAGNDDDDPDEIVRKWVIEHVPDAMIGHAVSGMILDGVPGYLTGTSLTNRVGMQDMWFHSNDRDMNATQQWTEWTTQLLGAGAGVARQIYMGAEDIAKGNIERGVEKMLPAALRNVAKAIRYLNEGVQDKYGNPIVDDVPLQDALKQAIGFTPAEIADRMARNTFQNNMQDRIEKERTAARKTYARAVMKGDAEAASKAMEAIGEYNQRRPQFPITGRSIMDSIRNMQRRKDRMEFGVDLDPKLRETVKARTAPSIYDRTAK